MDSAKRQLYLLEEERERLHDVTDALWQCRTRIEDNNLDTLPLRDDEYKAITPLLEAGYELVGRGIGRLVLRLPTTSELDAFVVKLGRYGNDLLSIGMFQNHQEITLWKDVGHKGWPLLRPLDWQTAQTRWLIMPYGTPLDDTSLSEEMRKTLLDKAIEQLERLGDLDELEFEPSNFVLWNDNVWLADYGRPKTDNV